MEYVRTAFSHLSVVLQALLWDAIDAGEDFSIPVDEDNEGDVFTLGHDNGSKRRTEAQPEAVVPQFAKPTRRRSCSRSSMGIGVGDGAAEEKRDAVAGHVVTADEGDVDKSAAHEGSPSGSGKEGEALDGDG